MGAPSLFMMAQRAAAKHAHNLSHIGDIPWIHAQHFLKSIRDPATLHEIEMNSPHIADADAELWKAFIRRDCPSFSHDIPEPTNPRSWWKIHRKLLQKENALKAEAENALRQSLQALESQKGVVHVSNAVMRDPSWRQSRLPTNGSKPVGANKAIAKIRKQVQNRVALSKQPVAQTLTIPDLSKKSNSSHLSDHMGHGLTAKSGASWTSSSGQLPFRKIRPPSGIRSLAEELKAKDVEHKTKEGDPRAELPGRHTVSGPVEEKGLKLGLYSQSTHQRIRRLPPLTQQSEPMSLSPATASTKDGKLPPESPEPRRPVFSRKRSPPSIFAPPQRKRKL